jgi:hypothetical protein
MIPARWVWDSVPQPPPFPDSDIGTLFSFFTPRDPYPFLASLAPFVISLCILTLGDYPMNTIKLTIPSITLTIPTTTQQLKTTLNRAKTTLNQAKTTLKTKIHTATAPK